MIQLLKKVLGKKVAIDTNASNANDMRTVTRSKFEPSLAIAFIAVAIAVLFIFIASSFASVPAAGAADFSTSTIPDTAGILDASPDVSTSSGEVKGATDQVKVKSIAPCMYEGFPRTILNSTDPNIGVPTITICVLFSLDYPDSLSGDEFNEALEKVDMRLTYTISEKAKKFVTVEQTDPGKTSPVTFISSSDKTVTVPSNITITGLRTGVVALKVALKSNPKLTTTFYVWNGLWSFDSGFPFKDLKGQPYTFVEAVKWLYSVGVTTGTTPTTYAPNNPVTRLQMALFLYRLVGEPKVPSSVKNPFKDLKGQEVFVNAVKWLVNEKVTTGTTPTTYAPNNPVTRLQMALFLYRLAGEPKVASSVKNPFNDLKGLPEAYVNAVRWLVNEEVTTGTTPTTYAPNNPVTRLQMALFMNRFYNYLTAAECTNYLTEEATRECIPHYAN